MKRTFFKWTRKRPKKSGFYWCSYSNEQFHKSQPDFKEKVNCSFVRWVNVENGVPKIEEMKIDGKYPQLIRTVYEWMPLSSKEHCYHDAWWSDKPIPKPVEP